MEIYDPFGPGTPAQPEKGQHSIAFRAGLKQNMHRSQLADLFPLLNTRAPSMLRDIRPFPRPMTGCSRVLLSITKICAFCAPCSANWRRFSALRARKNVIEIVGGNGAKRVHLLTLPLFHNKLRTLRESRQSVLICAGKYH